jgi:excisionase family DNA binding protein
MERLMDAGEAAEYLGYAPLTIRRMASKGKIPSYAFPCGSKIAYRFRASELESYISNLRKKDGTYDKK